MSTGLLNRRSGRDSRRRYVFRRSFFDNAESANRKPPRFERGHAGAIPASATLKGSKMAQGRRASDGATPQHRPAAPAACGIRHPPPSRFYGAMVKPGSWDTRSVQFRGRLPIAPPVSPRARARVCPRGEKTSRLLPKEQFRVRFPARAKGRGVFSWVKRYGSAPRSGRGGGGSTPPTRSIFADVAQRKRRRVQNASSRGSNPRVGKIFRRGTVRGTAETHNLLQAGSSPAPATNFGLRVAPGPKI